MRHTKGKRNRVRSHHALTATRLLPCTHCKQPAIRHQVCKNCGYYKDVRIVDVLAKLDKKDRKKKEQELRSQKTAQE